MSINEFLIEFIILKNFKKLFKKNLKIKYNFLNKPSLWMLLSTNFPLTKKSKNSRMGKGKGSFLRWSMRVKKNLLLFKFYSINKKRIKVLVQNFLKKTNYKFFILNG